MTRHEFAARLAKDGADLNAWPPGPQRAARALLLRSPGWRQCYLRALETDPTLELATLAPDEAHRLAARLRADLVCMPQSRAGLLSHCTPARGAALAACVAIGLAIGWYGSATRTAAPLVYAAADLTPFTGSGE